MADSKDRVADHYGVGDIGQRVLSAVEASGKDPDSLTVEDLSAVDEFHIRGRGATEELARWADVRPEHSVLDVGSGIGGTARYLAATAGCQVIGVDLTEEYCRVAESLSERVGLAERTSFRQGSALDLPFDEASFDVVWTEHVQMNIADKARFYGELARVLKPGGQLAFHDIFAGAGGDVHLPVPWATEPGISHLIGVDELRSVLADAGLEAARWEDKTEASIAFFEAAFERAREEGRMPLGIHILMEDAETKLGNVLKNLQDGRIRVLQAVMRPV